MYRCSGKWVPRKAVDEKNTGWLEINRWDWEQRKDLFDYVTEKGADVTVWFIQSVDTCKTAVYLLHSLTGEKG